MCWLFRQFKKEYCDGYSTRNEHQAYIFSTQAHVVDVEGDDGHGGGKGHEADGDAVVES